MKYLVMECHPAYAVVLDEKEPLFESGEFKLRAGADRFLRHRDETSQSRPALRKWLVAAASLASSLLILFFGAWQFLLVPYGSVRLQINPDVLISVNRLDYVVGVEGLNQDGGGSGRRFRISLQKTGGSDGRTGRSGHQRRLFIGWRHHLARRPFLPRKLKQEAQERLILSLDDHLGGTVRIATGVPEENEDDIPPAESETSSQPETGFSPESIVIPAAPPSQETTAPESKPQTPPANTRSSVEDDDEDDDPDHDDDDGEADDDDDDDDGKDDDEDD